MFIAQNPLLPTAPFGGAELKFTDTVQVYSAPPNGASSFVVLDSINISLLSD